jgi:hypothetical protein
MSIVDSRGAIGGARGGSDGEHLGGGATRDRGRGHQATALLDDRARSLAAILALSIHPDSAAVSWQAQRGSASRVTLCGLLS